MVVIRKLAEIGSKPYWPSDAIMFSSTFAMLLLSRYGPKPLGIRMSPANSKLSARLPSTLVPALRVIISPSIEVSVPDNELKSPLLSNSTLMLIALIPAESMPGSNSPVGMLTLPLMLNEIPFKPMVADTPTSEPKVSLI